MTNSNAKDSAKDSAGIKAGLSLIETFHLGQTREFDTSTGEYLHNLKLRKGQEDEDAKCADYIFGLNTRAMVPMV